MKKILMQLLMLAVTLGFLGGCYVLPPPPPAPAPVPPPIPPPHY